MATTSLTKPYTGLGRTEGKCELGTAARVRSLRFSIGLMLAAFFLGLIDLSAASAQSPHPRVGEILASCPNALASAPAALTVGIFLLLGEPLLSLWGLVRPDHHNIWLYIPRSDWLHCQSPTAQASGSLLNLGSLPLVACLPQPSSFTDSGTNSHTHARTHTHDFLA